MSVRRQVVLELPLSPQECAELAGVHYHTILRRIESGDLRAYHPAGGRGYVVHPADFEAWLYGRPVEPRDVTPAEPAARRARPAETGSVEALDRIEQGQAA